MTPAEINQALDLIVLIGGFVALLAILAPLADHFERNRNHEND